jgi:hypothetical protein
MMPDRRRQRLNQRRQRVRQDCGEPPLKSARRADADQSTHEEPEIETGDVD